MDLRLYTWKYYCHI